MVRAILEGRKTQTRRVINPQPFLAASSDDGQMYWLIDYEDPTKRAAWPEHDEPFWVHCPYGKSGDRLWVREVWAPHDKGVVSWKERELVYYRADDETVYDTDGKWRTPIFMPRWASRITLEIVSVQVERLQEMKCEDVLAEGSPIPLREHSNPELGIQCVSAKEWFQQGWDSLNAKRGYSWASNPWVWVLEFRVVNGREQE
jgi:hypothetical protein